MTNKELKKQISKLRKLKNKMQPHSKERVELHRKIKEMKKELEQLKIIDKEKQPLIDEILKIRPEYVTLELELNKYTKEQLEFHLNKIKEKNA